MAVVQGEISLKSSATNKNPLIISVFETISPEITIFPLNIQLPVGPLTQPNVSHITIRDNVANFTLSDPAVNAPGASVSMIMMQTNRTYVVTVVFPQGFAVQPGQSVFLTVKTDNPRFPLLTVPVTSGPGLAQPLPARPVATPPADSAALGPGRFQPARPPLPANRANPVLPPVAQAAFASPASATNSLLP